MKNSPIPNGIDVCEVSYREVSYLRSWPCPRQKRLWCSSAAAGYLPAVLFQFTRDFRVRLASLVRHPLLIK